MINKTTGATVWRHAFATSEMQKYETKTDYNWCTTMEQAAERIAFLMNTSSEEILTTYSTRQNQTKVTEMDHGAKRKN